MRSQPGVATRGGSTAYAGTRIGARRSARSTELWWGVALAGLLMFLVGNATARMGVVLLPFDPHHLIEQGGGALLAVIGALAASARS